MQYESLEKHLGSQAQRYGEIVDLIVRMARGRAPGEDVDIDAGRIPCDYDFLQDRELIAEMLAERPGVAFVEHHNNGFSLRLQEPAQEMKALTQDELEAKGLADPRPGREAQDDLEVIHARHTLWRYGEPGGEQADFSGMAMTCMDFSGKIFDGALFKDAQLYRCSLGCCGLDGAQFDGAVLEGCDFSKASCQEASFAGARISCCDFVWAQLDGADFSQAELADGGDLDDVAQGPAMTM
jgi:hypothetical protein